MRAINNYKYSSTTRMRLLALELGGWFGGTLGFFLMIGGRAHHAYVIIAVKQFRV